MNKYQKSDLLFEPRTLCQKQQDLHTSTMPPSCTGQDTLGTETFVLYALERKCGTVWIRYGLCGKYDLLERVRECLTPLAQWRIVYVSAHISDSQKIA